MSYKPNSFVEIRQGDCLDLLPAIPDDSIDCIVTSPPYWRKRDYMHPDQLGQEKTVEEYIAKMVVVFRQLRRVLKPTGSCWLNVDDSSLPNKSLALVPARLSIALQADGWIIRNDNIWWKPNPRPESVQDRMSRDHEYIFHLTKAEQYYFDIDAVRVPYDPATRIRIEREYAKGMTARYETSKFDEVRGDTGTIRMQKGAQYEAMLKGKNRRTVWRIAFRPFAGEHHAVFPVDIPEIAIKAACPPDGVVLDPFFGAGTTGLAASKLERQCIGLELNGMYAQLAYSRIRDEYPDLPLFHRREE